MRQLKAFNLRFAKCERCSFLDAESMIVLVDMSFEDLDDWRTSAKRWASSDLARNRRPLSLRRQLNATARIQWYAHSLGYEPFI